MEISRKILGMEARKGFKIWMFWRAEIKFRK